MASSQGLPHVAVVGAGWGGWGAAKALVENGCRVTLLDTLPDPTGRVPYLTPSGKPFEAGTRGFWKDYPNIIDLVNSLGLTEDQVFTPFTNSSFYSPDGLEATAPVFSNSQFPELPSPLGQVLATFSLFERIPVGDRVTMLGLLYAMLDYTRDEETFAAYDRMTAHELFVRMGISPRLVQDFIRPTLLVGLFKPPEELSAAVAMELLYFYALAHQTSFDVRWIKSRSISELIIAPMAESLLSQQLPSDSEYKPRELGAAALEEPQSGGALALSVLGSSRVSRVEVDALGKIESVVYRSAGGAEETMRVDACVLALGSRGMQAVIGGSKALARISPELCAAASMPSIDVIACRIWLDTQVQTRTPANVFSRFPALRGAGGTFFMLDQLQDDEPELLWGGENPQGSVLACDFYNAGALLAMSDADLVSLLMDELLPAAVPAFAQTKVVDSHVARYPGAVTWFGPGSFSRRPPLQTSISNLVCAGDWVRMGKREHGAKGLCQERAYVSGLEAANSLARSGALGASHRREHPVIPIRDDEPQVLAGRELNRKFMEALKPLGLSSPW
eukprot:CAMPEP_0119319692 /NCGR_PEP_ID=MMETSP1333-20130426/50067_1 /TAXON_ID=418940 /ORGANISM="Scyphosphaera apsteinii, Strain RCC1455" /LENGTH=561 /DNA_ID=CAMNT_0007326165 /DNA_START=101 /DNA_END=1783 /DNA_ORIENTATION=+